jgi:hypothetical protein
MGLDDKILLKWLLLECEVCIRNKFQWQGSVTAVVGLRSPQNAVKFLDLMKKANFKKGFFCVHLNSFRIIDK